METRLLAPAFCFMMKYFFDVEKEITQQLLSSAQLHLVTYKDALMNLYHTTVK